MGSFRDLLRAVERHRVREHVRSMRCYLIEELEDQVVLWECPSGHRFQQRAQRPLSPDVKKLWSKGRFGARVTCPVCLKEMFEQIDEDI